MILNTQGSQSSFIEKSDLNVHFMNQFRKQKKPCKWSINMNVSYFHMIDYLYVSCMKYAFNFTTSCSMKYWKTLLWNRRQFKVSFFGHWSKMQLIPLQNFIIKTCFIQFLWFFILKCWFKGQIISRIHRTNYRNSCSLSLLKPT